MKSEDFSVAHLEAGVDKAGDATTLKYDKHNRLLEPQPMNDANDPLNWSAIRKLIIIVVVAAWTFLGTLNMIVAGPTFYPVAAELEADFSLTTYLVGGPLLAYGVASLFWVAAANRYGVRLSFVLSATVAGCLGIWGAKASTFGQLVAARTLASIAYASPETLAPQVVADVFFLKDRAKCMGCVLAMQASGFSMGPLVGAFIVQNLGWRWTQWTMTILALGVAAAILILVPETQYTADLKFAVVKRTFTQEFRFTRVSGGGRAKVHSFPIAFLYPFRYIRHPVVIMVTVYFSLYLLATNYILTAQSISYTIVYNFSVGASGLTYFAAVLGVWFCMCYCGLLQDAYLNRKAKSEDYQPEQRLRFLLVACIAGTAGTALFGACTEAQCHWFVPIIGMFCNLFGFLCASSLAIAYIVDVYLARGDAALVIVNGFKNFAAFGISYAIIPWNMSVRYAVPFGVLAAVVFAAHLIMLVRWWKGQNIRRWTAARFVAARETHHGEEF